LFYLSDISFQKETKRAYYVDFISPVWLYLLSSGFISPRSSAHIFPTFTFLLNSLRELLRFCYFSWKKKQNPRRLYLLSFDSFFDNFIRLWAAPCLVSSHSITNPFGVGVLCSEIRSKILSFYVTCPLVLSRILGPYHHPPSGDGVGTSELDRRSNLLLRFYVSSSGITTP
jgi:hypothetical protein